MRLTWVPEKTKHSVFSHPADQSLLFLFLRRIPQHRIQVLNALNPDSESLRLEALLADEELSFLHLFVVVKTFIKGAKALANLSDLIRFELLQLLIWC